MKNKFLLAIAFLCLSASILVAQNRKDPSGLTVKGLATDYHAPFNDKYFEPSQWKYGAEIGFFRYISDYASVGFPLRVGKVDFPVNEFLFDEDKLQTSLDVLLKFHTPNKKSFIDAYAFAGLGGNYIFDVDKSFDAQMPLGVGLDFKLSQKFYLQTQGEYRVSLVQEKDNIVYSAGLFYLFGKELPEPEKEEEEKEDKDKDGIPDDEDECIYEKGSAEFGGCPDSDEDGVQDNKDNCPDVAGKVDKDGCPGVDSDGDGVDDDEDACPNVAGLELLGGCLDSDADGIADHLDGCPNKAGASGQNGCPDSDKDGILDNVDPCPMVAGTDGKGCPEISQSDKDVLIFATDNIEFGTNSSFLHSEAKAILNNVANVLSRHPDKFLSIEAHTDNIGDANYNLALSEKRAKMCYDYLITQGITSNRMSYVGFGEEAPIDTNDDASGRKKNRRAELKIKQK